MNNSPQYALKSL